MTKESNPTSLSRTRLSKSAADRPSSTTPHVLSAASVTDASNEWKKYCDGRLRHFATGR